MDKAMSWIPSCSDVARAVADGSYDDSDFFRRAALRLHMAVCWVCRRYAAQIRWIDAAVLVIWGASHHADVDFKRRLIARLR